jgi:hypothetical protein
VFGCALIGSTNEVCTKASTPMVRVHDAPAIELAMFVAWEEPAVRDDLLAAGHQPRV